LPVAAAISFTVQPRLSTELAMVLAPGMQVLGILGEGGMGVVYLSRDPVLKRSVAVKVLAPQLADDPEARARFLREAQAAAAVSHPNVVSIYQVGTLPDSGTPFFVMQLVDGTPLDQVYPIGHPAREHQVRRVIGEIASALAAAHARGLVHRDIKPSNVIVERATGRAVVVDFGIAAALDRQVFTGATIAATSGYLGTPTFTSPEQATHRELTGASDVYSLGVLAFQLVTGRLPFLESTPLTYLAAHLKETPPRVSTLRGDLDPALAQLIDRCLSKDPAARPTAVELARYLLPAREAAVEWPPPGLEPLQGEGAGFLGAAAGAIALALVCFWLLPGRAFRAEGWDIAVGILGAGMVLQVGRAGWRAIRLFELFTTGRRVGYPWGALFDVATDRSNDMASLMNGVDHFAFLSPLARERLLRFRRWRVAWFSVALMLQALVPLLWLYRLGPSATWGAERTLDGRAGLLLLTPALLGLVGVTILGFPEWSFRFRSGSIRLHRLLASMPHAQVVRGWLVGAGQDRRTSLGPLAKVLAFVTLAVLLVGLSNATLIVVQAARVARESPIPPPPAGPLAVARFLRSYRQLERLMQQNRDRLVPPPGSRLPGFLQVNAARMAAFQIPDSTAGTLLFLVGHRHGADVDSSFAIGPEALDLWSGDTAGEPATRFRPGFERLTVVIPGALRDSLARDTLTSRLELWRRTARATPFPPLWYLRTGMPGVSGFEQLEQRLAPGLATIAELANRNLAAAVLLFQAGEREAAQRKARENLAVGWQLMSASAGGGWTTGGQLVHDGAAAFIGMARALGDSGLAREGAELRQLSDSLGVIEDGRLSLDPTPSILPEIPVALRVLWLRQLARGFCSNTWEILLGVDPNRLATLDLVSGVDGRGPELRGLAAADLVGQADDPRGPESLLQQMHWLGATAVRARMLRCTDPARPPLTTGSQGAAGSATP
jgi:tRNA A-37 threonylcarbamoyl transferase component Bud32